MQHDDPYVTIRHNERNIGISRYFRKSRRTYIGSINGEVCAFGPAKGELLRKLIEMARSYPKAPKPVRKARIARPRKGQ